MNLNGNLNTSCSADLTSLYYAISSGDFARAGEKARDLEACALGMGDEELAEQARALAELAKSKVSDTLQGKADLSVGHLVGESCPKCRTLSGQNAQKVSDTLFVGQMSSLLNQTYGPTSTWPAEVKQALAKLSSARGSAAFASEAAKIINELRLSPETYPAFEIGTALLANQGGELLAAAKSLEASAASGVIGDKTASFAYDFIFGNPENTLLPLYAAGKLGKLVEGLTALGAEALGVTRAATTALKTTTGLATEAPVFVGTGKVVAYEKGKPVELDAGTFFKESFSSGLVFGGLKAAGFFAQTFNLFLPSTEAGRALSFWNANFASVGALMAVSGAERLAAGEHAEARSNLDAFVEALVVHLGLTKMMGSVNSENVGSEFSLLKNLSLNLEVRRYVTPAGTSPIALNSLAVENAPAGSTSKSKSAAVVSVGGYTVKEFKDPQVALAREFVSLLADTISKKGRAVVSLPLYDLLPEFFGELLKFAGKPFWGNVVVFGQHELIGILPQDANSSHSRNTATVYDKLGIPRKNVHAINGKAMNVTMEAKKYEADVTAAGGIDIFVTYIGKENLGFNIVRNNGRPFVKNAVVIADYRRLLAQAYKMTIDELPDYALFLGMSSIKSAAKVLAVALSCDAKPQIDAALHKEPTQNNQLSALHNHDSVTVFTNFAAESTQSAPQTDSQGTKLNKADCDTMLRKAKTVDYQEKNQSMALFVEAAKGYETLGETAKAIEAYLLHIHSLTTRLSEKTNRLLASQNDIRGRLNSAIRVLNFALESLMNARRLGASHDLLQPAACKIGDLAHDLAENSGVIRTKELRTVEIIDFFGSITAGLRDFIDHGVYQHLVKALNSIHRGFVESNIEDIKAAAATQTLSGRINSISNRNCRTSNYFNAEKNINIVLSGLRTRVAKIRAHLEGLHAVGYHEFDEFAQIFINKLELQISTYENILATEFSKTSAKRGVSGQSLQKK